MPRAVTDVQDRNNALLQLRQHPRFKPQFEKNFEYDPHSRTYKEKRPTYYTYTPVVSRVGGTYQVQATHQQEVAYIRPRHPDLETFKRRRFNRAASKRPIDGRAKKYLNVGPWIRLRLLKTTVHITRQGKPPLKAYTILAKHLLKQISFSEKPRIVVPNFKGQKKQMPCDNRNASEHQ